MKLKKEDLMESWKKRRVFKRIPEISYYNKNPDYQSTIDTANKRGSRIIFSKNAPEDVKDLVDRKEILRAASRAASRAGERIDPSNKMNVGEWYQKFAKISDAAWLGAANLGPERRNKEKFLRLRLKRITGKK